MFAFYCCYALTEVKFGNKLERFERDPTPYDNPFGDLPRFYCSAFADCGSLERITIPLKDGLITADDTFTTCGNLKYVDLVEGEINQFMAALQWEDWRNDMKEEIDSINRILPNARAGVGMIGEYLNENDNLFEWRGDDHGEKAQAIRRWIRSVLGKINDYKAEHDHLLNKASATLQLVLPRDIAMNGVLPFLALPLHEFEVEDELDEEEDHSEEAEDDSEVSDDEDDDQNRHVAMPDEDILHVDVER